MATEARRRCGYRKVGGLYLVAPEKNWRPCDRLPHPLTVCPCCGAGIKQARGWTWVDVAQLFQGVHRDCQDQFPCPLCMATSDMGAAGLLWIGGQFYPTPDTFNQEADELGISRRISALPRNFKLGETWVLLAHSKACTCPTCGGKGYLEEPQDAAGESLPPVTPICETCQGCGRAPGIFRAFRPVAVEKIVTASQAQDQAAMDDLARRGIIPVVVPDDDKDHQGSVYDTDEPSAPLFQEGGAE